MAGAARRANNLDALRLFGAMLVVVGHAFVLTGAEAPRFGGRPLHVVGVCIFFAISGYLITRSWLSDPRPWRFLARRALRILPALVVVVFATVLLLGPAMTVLDRRDYFADPRTVAYLTNAVLRVRYDLPGVFLDNPFPVTVNGSLWTLPVEALLYLTVPLFLATAALRGGRLRLALLAPVAAVAVMIALRHHLPDPDRAVVNVLGVDPWAAIGVIPYFLIGACVSAGRWEWLLDARLAGVAILAVALIDATPVVMEALMLLALPYGALAIGLAPAPSWNRTDRVGDLSYGLYLWSFPVQQTIVVLLAIRAPGWGNLLLVVAASMMLAFASWHLIEKRCLAWKPARPGGPGVDGGHG